MMFTRSLVQQQSKSRLKVWLALLLAFSYGIVILFTFWNQKKRELNFSIERVKLPGSEKAVHQLDLKVKLDQNTNHSFSKNANSQDKFGYHVDRIIVKSTSIRVEPTRSVQEYTPVTQYQKAKLQHATGPLLDYKIMSFPNKNQTRFATFGITTPGTENYFYAFNAPLAVRAWRRIGYDCIVFIIGNFNEWMSREILKHIYLELVSLTPAIVFLVSLPDNEVLLSQACRLFAANYFAWSYPNDTIIVTSDVDLWPLTATMYEIPKNKSILSLNSDCCGSFDHKGHIYKMFPLGNIVSTTITWKQMINTNGFYPRKPNEIIDYFFREFGPVALERTRKLEYIGWYMDQRMVSLKLSQWMTRYGGSNVKFVARDVGRDRIDSNYWMPFSLYNRNDVHVLPDIYQPGTWEKIRPLLKLMYSKDEEFQIVEYREIFMKLFISSKMFR